VATTIGSPALLLQLVTNLVHNAIVHSLPTDEHGHGTGHEHGTGTGTVWVTTTTDPDHVELTVENTGEKLAPELVATLTEPFQRGTERVRKDHIGGDHVGVGLGLAIVKSITAAHDGTLTLTARPAGGLRVTVRLRAVRRPPAIDAPEARYVPTRLRPDYVMGKSK
jgi:two-component system sensor histidine kinase VanS